MSATAEQAGTRNASATKETTMQALKPADPMNLPMQYVGFESLQGFELLQRVAKMFAGSSIVPQRFQNNIANCAIAVEMAHRLRASPLMVMQNLYVVYGQPGWAAKFLIACFNQCGRFSSIRYKFQGTPGKDDWGCRAWAIELATGERLEGPLITIELAKKEGWYDRKDSKWKTMPEQMLRYRSGAWFINTTAPEISMGLPTAEELHDTLDTTRGPDGTFVVTTDSLRGDKQESGQENADASAGTDAEAATDNDLGGYVPQWNEKTAIAAAKKAESLQELDDLEAKVHEDFRVTRRSIPMSVEATFNDRREFLKQKQEL